MKRVDELQQGDVVIPETPDGRAWVLDGGALYGLPQATVKARPGEVPERLQLVLRDNLPADELVIVHETVEQSAHIDAMEELLDRVVAAVPGDHGDWQDGNSPWRRAVEALERHPSN